MKHILSLLTLFAIVSHCLLAQDTKDSLKVNTEIIGLKIKPAGTLEFATPQKYGAAANVTIGVLKEDKVPMGEGIYRSYYGIEGINLEAGIFRGGYRFGLYYINVGSSMVGTVGTRLGAVYLNNNSFSFVTEGKEMIGLEAEIYAIYKFKVGIVKEMESKKVIPSIGFGFAIGPNLY